LFFNLNELETTETEEKVIAPAAITGPIGVAKTPKEATGKAKRL
jgi:hypothetical protein